MVIFRPVAAIALFAGIFLLAAYDEQRGNFRKYVGREYHPPAPQFDNGHIEAAIGLRDW